MLNCVVEMCLLNQIPPVCPPPGEDPEDWVDCSEGRVRGTNTPCEDACGDDCCTGPGACFHTTACIKKDGSCNGASACNYAGYSGAQLFAPKGYFSFYDLKISGPSCVGDKACQNFIKNIYNTEGNAEMSLTNSCLCDFACRNHCSYSSAPPRWSTRMWRFGHQRWWPKELFLRGELFFHLLSLLFARMQHVHSLTTTSASLLYSILQAAKRISIVDTLEHSIVDTLEHPVRFVEADSGSQAPSYEITNKAAFIQSIGYPFCNNVGNAKQYCLGYSVSTAELHSLYYGYEPAVDIAQQYCVVDAFRRPYDFSFSVSDALLRTFCSPLLAPQRYPFLDCIISTFVIALELSYTRMPRLY